MLEQEPRGGRLGEDALPALRRDAQGDDLARRCGAIPERDEWAAPELGGVVAAAESEGVDGAGAGCAVLAGGGTGCVHDALRRGEEGLLILPGARLDSVLEAVVYVAVTPAGAQGSRYAPISSSTLAGSILRSRRWPPLFW